MLLSAFQLQIGDIFVCHVFFFSCQPRILKSTLLLLISMRNFDAEAKHNLKILMTFWELCFSFNEILC